MKSHVSPLQPVRPARPSGRPRTASPHIRLLLGGVLLGFATFALAGCSQQSGERAVAPEEQSGSDGMPAEMADLDREESAGSEPVTPPPPEAEFPPHDALTERDLRLSPMEHAEIASADERSFEMAPLRSESEDSTFDDVRTPMAIESDAMAAPRVELGPFESLPAGSTRDAKDGFATIAVYYATDRERDPVPLSAYAVQGNRDALVLLGGSAAIFLCLALFNIARRRSAAGIGSACLAGVAAAGAVVIVWTGTANIEKHGVTYTADRGSMVHGVAEVTVPDTHQRGQLERPTLLHFEVRENQQDHIVLTSATELSDGDFHQRLSQTVASSPNQDLLVFIHGYNVDFESALQRTAQLAVDLPFEGVPVCYSWPSQGKLLRYTVDEANAAWTQSHLKEFLLDLSARSGARSINVIAHSMGNRPTTGALAEIHWQRQADSETETLLDRLVLAAPDVDADRFRRDLAPVLVNVANQVTLYASSDDQALVASKRVHGSPRAGESGESLVVVPGIETVDVSGIDLSLLGHSYYGDSPSMLQELYELVRGRLPAARRRLLQPRPLGELTYWQLVPSRVSNLAPIP